MACKQKAAKRPQGRARDDVKVIITGPLKKIALMFYWWSRALQWGNLYRPPAGMKAHLKRAKQAEAGTAGVQSEEKMMASDSEIIVQLNYKYVNPTVDIIFRKSAAESRKTFGNSLEVKLLRLIQ